MHLSAAVLWSQVPEGLEKAKLKLHFNMNLNGLVTLTQATSITEIEEVVEVTQVPAPGAAAVAEPTPNGEAAGAAPPADGAVPMAEDGGKGEGENGSEKVFGPIGLVHIVPSALTGRAPVG